MNELKQKATKFRQHVGIGLAADELELLLVEATEMLELMEPLWHVIAPLLSSEIRKRVSNLQARDRAQRLNDMAAAVEILARRPDSAAALLDLCRMADSWRTVRYE